MFTTHFQWYSDALASSSHTQLACVWILFSSPVLSLKNPSSGCTNASRSNGLSLWYASSSLQSWRLIPQGSGSASSFCHVCLFGFLFSLSAFANFCFTVHFMQVLVQPVAFFFREKLSTLPVYLHELHFCVSEGGRVIWSIGVWVQYIQWAIPEADIQATAASRRCIMFSSIVECRLGRIESIHKYL